MAFIVTTHTHDEAVAPLAYYTHNCCGPHATAINAELGLR
jgi:hypothetical protein